MKAFSTFHHTHHIHPFSLIVISLLHAQGEGRGGGIGQDRNNSRRKLVAGPQRLLAGVGDRTQVERADRNGGAHDRPRAS
jgi:hypothetical protein